MSSSSTMQDDEDAISAAAAAVSKPRFKRNRLIPSLTHNSIPSDNVAFRLLCHTSKCGAVIGRSGTLVKFMEQETGSVIRMENSIRGCNERVITVIGSKSLNRTILVRNSNNVQKLANKENEEENGDDEEEEEEEEEEGEEVEVSVAQHGLIRVLERVLETEAEIEEVFPTPGLVKGSHTCRLLAYGSHIGHLIGQHGSRIKKIEEDSGARVFISSRCPPCASPSDELIQITGGSLALKKAALAVSSRLQKQGPLDKVQMIGSKSAAQAPNRAFSDPNTEFRYYQTSFAPCEANSTVDYASRGSFMQTDEIVFRIICTEDKIGGLIGKGGTIVRSLQDQTGASIRVGAPVPESADRVVHISAMEDMKSQYSPAQNAVIRVFTRSTEVGKENRIESGDTVEARLLVHASKIGCLIGKGGAIISEMRKAAHVNMWVISGEHVPPCAAENDTVLRICGGFHNVKHALSIATGKLRDSFFPNKMVNTASSSAGSYSLMDKSGQATLAENFHHLGLSHSPSHSLSPKFQRSRVNGENRRGPMNSGKEATALWGGLEHGSGRKSAILANTTLEILVAENVLPWVFGENDSNLNRLREISGARVEVHEPFPGTDMAKFVISGTPDQTQAAQSILQAYILSSEGS